MAGHCVEFLEDDLLDVGDGFDGDRPGMALDCLTCALLGDPEFVADLLVRQVLDPQVPGASVTFDGLGRADGPSV